MSIVRPGEGATGTVHLSTFDDGGVPQAPDLDDPLPHYATLCGAGPTNLSRRKAVCAEDLCPNCRKKATNGDRDFDMVGVIIE